MIRNITIIGSGVMGTGIAQSFALNGYRVTLNDISQEYLAKADIRIQADMETMIDEESISLLQKEQALQNIKYEIDIEKALELSDFIIEAIPEVLEMKWKLYSKIEKLISKDTIIASNTSTFPISRLAENASFANRMVITHFFNPAHLVPLVEIVKHEKTEESILAKTIELMRSIGKKPVVVKKEISGFIANRLQTALMREAFYLLNEGVASAEDIDTAVTAGPGFRWAFTGPIEIADFGGLDTWQRVFDNVAPELDKAVSAPNIIKALVAQNKLGAKSGEGIFHYGEETVSNKLNDRDRSYIQLNQIKKKDR
ncbi:3-hydroxyacyl-CoA dehydrogenase family protein [Cytobacillus horneckiae]|uniref:3-hydroxybutyryl-CoA dehydrogenase n=1 Tax=Cytobacillus horneckiae TaxID=549687 RepID=A0A2N0ZDC0_9BACI|nr:3-hydroxyacyl-CoA dehydrogenase family protein [Cytobacillus horneckiae]MCM3178832.1 3-hydroxyacyl-CoA dehydrogenase family protein [Cytobacillus horneckiae]MEC1158760.1 3-hydroxyacyl-CoA dehydrogenase family protein [Cytobacillus horneckiae]MED2937283.1 3-hydroxyacyl-CoA dehydrogenase family protein [Cytobacillus horneckiae]PKG27496.1 3-hydroxybutyryl-CoA dehydrogenase [Cytobacillus horneckiae]